jgi:cytochrome c oxidase cbb3-type subunit 3/ubiquinol-cytochrome c reductase cytochrome c subunit
MTAKRRFTFTLFLLATAVLAGCNRLHGKPTEEERWVAPTEVMDFKKLFGQNCAGCHGTEGRQGAVRALNDPLYLSLVKPEQMQQVISNGVPGTPMPAFLIQQGGTLTDKQIAALIDGIRSQWGRADDFKNVTLPPYSLKDAGAMPGDQSRGAAAYQKYCIQCHGAEGRGGDIAGSIVDPNFLAIVSDQGLRTTVIAGRTDLGMPDWQTRKEVMTPQDISDVVAWIISHRTTTTASQSEPVVKPATAETHAPEVKPVTNDKGGK